MIKLFFTFFYLNLKFYFGKKVVKIFSIMFEKPQNFYLNRQLDTGTNTFVNHFRQMRFDMKIYILIFPKTSRIKSLPNFRTILKWLLFLFFLLLCLPLNLIEVV
jgi:hypothetical protein